MMLFNADNPAKRSSLVRLFTNKIKAPYVYAQVSTLGGVERASVILHVSLDPKSKWSNGIFQNSRYFLMRIDRNGTMEMFSKSYRILSKMRQVRVASLPNAIARINKFILSVK